MTSISRNEDISKLVDIVNIYNHHTRHTTIKMKSVDVKSSTHINFVQKIMKKIVTFEVGDHVK